MREAGKFAIRGGIIDLFRAGDREPLQLDLFGDELEGVQGLRPDEPSGTTEKRRRFRVEADVPRFFLDRAIDGALPDPAIAGGCSSDSAG